MNDTCFDSPSAMTLAFATGASICLAIVSVFSRVKSGSNNSLLRILGMHNGIVFPQSDRGPFHAPYRQKNTFLPVHEALQRNGL